MRTVLILSVLIIFNSMSSHAQSYSVTISHEDDDIYSINYGDFYVQLYHYNYCYGEEVLLKVHKAYYGYTGEICWEKEEYDYDTGENYTVYSDCYNIQQTYTPISCTDCKTLKNGSIEDVEIILKPVSLDKIVN